jgi:hypothetical protein
MYSEPYFDGDNNSLEINDREERRGHIKAKKARQPGLIVIKQRGPAWK